MEKNIREIIEKILLSIADTEIQSIQLNPLFKEEFNAKLKETYNTSSVIVKSEIIDQFAIQDDKEFLIKHLIIDNTKNKPILINQTNYKDPFAPPIHPDILITDNFCNLNHHRVILTKFPLFKEQVLLVSREFVDQYTHLTIENIQDLIIVTNFIDGFGFFNGGMKAGASQPRKHLQAVPYHSLPKKSFGLFSYVQTESKLELIPNLQSKLFQSYCLNALNSKDNPHILIKFSIELTNMIKDSNLSASIGKIILAMYHIGLLYLGIDCNSQKIEKDYSFLFTQEWMFIVLRKENEVYINEKDKLNKNYINLNSLAFFWIIISRSKEQIKDMIEGNIVKDVLSKL